MPNVAIKYQFFQIYSDSNKNQLYEFRKWIDIVSKCSLKDRIKKCNQITGRLENVYPIYNDEFYLLNFMRMDEFSSTYIVNPDKHAKHVDLQENEYIAKNTVVLYDPRYNALMIQCNRGSYGVYALQSYINSFMGQSQKCELVALIYNTDDVLNKNRACFKMDLRIKNINNLVTKTPYFERLINVLRESGCLTAHVEVGIGKASRKVNELDRDSIDDIVRDIQNEKNKNEISAAKVTLMDDRKSTIVDLIDKIFNTSIYYTLKAREELALEYIEDRMATKYDAQIRPIIANIVGDK